MRLDDGWTRTEENGSIVVVLYPLTWTRECIPAALLLGVVLGCQTRLDDKSRIHEAPTLWHQVLQ